MLLLLWWSWSAYAWVGNQARADRGLIELGMILAMAALLVARLVMPYAWGGGRLDAPVILAVSLAVVRIIYTSLYLYVAACDDRLRAQVLLGAIPLSVAWVAFVVGALLGGTASGWAGPR